MCNPQISYFYNNRLNTNFGLQQKNNVQVSCSMCVCYLKTQFGKVDGASAPGHKMSQHEATGIPVLQ